MASPPAHRPAAAAPASSAAAPAAPDAEGGSAFGFLFYVYPDPQPLCPLLVALNATTDPAVDRGSCLLFNFSTTGAVGAVEADFYAEGAADPFVEGVVADPDTDPGTFQVSTAPDADWPAGRIRLVVRDTAGPIGEFVVLPQRPARHRDRGGPQGARRHVHRDRHAQRAQQARDVR